MPTDPDNQPEETLPEDSPSYNFFLSAEVLDAAADPTPPDLSEEDLAADREREAEQERRKRIRERNEGRGFGSLIPLDDEPAEDGAGEGEDPPAPDPDQAEGDDPPADKGEEGEEPPPARKKLKVSKADPFPAPSTPPASPTPSPAKEPAKPEEPAPKPDAKADEPDPYELTDDDRSLIDELPAEARDAAYDALDLWKQASAVDPEKYGKQFDQWKKFFLEDATRRQKVLEKDPDADPDEDPQYLAWRKRSKPADLSRVEARKLEREIITHEAEQRAAAKLSEETRELREWKQRKEVEERALPELHRTVNQYGESFVEELKGDEVVGDFIATYEEAGGGEAGFQAAREEFGDAEADLMAGHYRSGLQLLNTMVACRQGLEAFDESNTVHTEAAKRVHHWEQALNSDPKRRVRDDKEFAPWSEYVNLPEQERAKRWTLTNDLLSKMMRAEVRQRLTKDVKSHRERIEAEIARLQKRTGAKKPAAAPAQSSAKPDQPPVDDGAPPPPRARPTRAPAPSSSAGSGKLDDFWGRSTD